MRASMAAARQDFRLTPTTGVPYITADVLAVGTLYFTPAWGDCISLYYPTNDVWERWRSSEISLNLNGIVVSGKNYDVFIYVDRATGAIAMELSAAWATDNTRTDAVDRYQGIRLKTANKTRRYIGSFRGSAANQTENSERNRLIYNFHNQRMAFCRYTDATAHDYSTNAWRRWNNDAAAGFTLLQGQVASCALGIANVSVQHNNNGKIVGFGLGLNTVAAPTTYPQQCDIPRSNELSTASASDAAYMLVGYNYIAALESGLAAGNTVSWKTFGCQTQVML